jgi:hypothetical protein
MSFFDSSGWSGFDPIMRVERLDLQEGGWDLLAPLSTPRCFLAAASDRGGNMFAIGGWVRRCSVDTGIEARAG